MGEYAPSLMTYLRRDVNFRGTQFLPLQGASLFVCFTVAISARDFAAYNQYNATAKVRVLVLLREMRNSYIP